MQILVSGSQGFIGSALVPRLTSGGHRVIRLIRASGPLSSSPSEPRVAWNPAATTFDASALDGLDAVIHLAGESLAAGRWTPARKAAIRESRVHGTRVLCEALARLSKPPNVVIIASATGYYGDRGEEALTEASAPGSGFLAEVCRDWEQAAEPAARRGIRLVQARFGVVLSPSGGALAKMLMPFTLGCGGPLGHGWQYLSWVSIDDVLGAILHLLTNDGVRGPVNIVSPQPVTNRDFARALGRVLRRPALLSVPAFVLRLLLGELADEALLASARVLPSKLLASGYTFRDPRVEDALRRLLGR